MKKNGNKMGFILVYGIIFAVINLLVFIIFKPWNITENLCVADFWWSYSFLTVSFILQFLTLFLFQKDGLPAIFMGMPLFIIGLIYFCIEAFLAVLFMILAVFLVPTPLTLVLVLQILALAAFLVCAILAVIGRNTINDIEKKQKSAVTNIRYLVADMEIACQSVENNPELKKDIQNVLEDIKYSDPMSVPQVAQLDDKIRDLVMQVKDLCQEASLDAPAIKDLLRKIRLSVKERNQKISISK